MNRKNIPLLLTLCLVFSGQSHDTSSAEDPYATGVSNTQRKTWRAEDDRQLETLVPELQARAQWIQEQLWDMGYPVRIASAKRTAEQQREGFREGYSKTLRSKHLCGKAVDFKLHPHIFPDSDSAFWDAKDKLAKIQGLLVLNAPSFKDRPHVELDQDCDWDAALLGPEGTWKNDTHTLTIRRDRTTRTYKGSLVTPDATLTLTSLRVRHTHSGPRNKIEDAFIDVTFKHDKKHKSQNISKTYKSSTIIAKTHHYQRASWTSLLDTGAAHTFKRVTK